MTRCYLRFDTDPLHRAKPCRSIAKARAKFERTAKALDSFGQRIEATLHFAKRPEQLDEYPDRALRLGKRGGVVVERC